LWWLYFRDVCLRKNVGQLPLPNKIWESTKTSNFEEAVSDSIFALQGLVGEDINVNAHLYKALRWYRGWISNFDIKEVVE